jgi:hypothetical protein
VGLGFGVRPAVANAVDVKPSEAVEKTKKTGAVDARVDKFEFGVMELWGVGVME